MRSRRTAAIATQTLIALAGNAAVTLIGRARGLAMANGGSIARLDVPAAPLPAEPA